MNVLRGLAVLAAIAMAAPAGAAVVNKCVAPDGKVTYSDKPCTTYQAAQPASQAAPGPAAEEAPSVQPAPEAAPEQAPEPAPEPDSVVAPPPGAERAPSAEGEGGDTGQAQSFEQQPEMTDEQMAALEGEFQRQVGGKMRIIFLASALMLVGWIMHIVAAARMDKIAWAICLFLLSPFSNIFFTIMYWQKAKVGFFVYLAGLIPWVWAVVSIFTSMAAAAGIQG